MKRRCWFGWILWALAAALGLCACRAVETAAPSPVPALENAAPEPLREMALQEGRAVIRETQETLDGVPVSQRVMTFPDGDTVTMGRAQLQGSAVELASWTVDGGTLHYYDRAEGRWVVSPLSSQTLQESMVELELDGGGSYLLYLPKTYACRENAALEYLPQQDGQLQITQTHGHWRLTLTGTAPELECVCDYTMVRSEGRLIDWSHPGSQTLWTGYTMEGRGKWCFDGYYWPSPDNYVPTGENCLYRCPASYLVKSFAYAASVHRGAKDLAIAMLDTLSQFQNEAGFWPTLSESQWLSGDYAIGAGFYDTRFNTDLVEIYLRVYSNFGGDSLRETLERYADFYMAYAEQHHFETVNGGWFVEDYFHPSGNLPTHCSLNHQAAECIALYHLSDTLDRADLADLAGTLLQAVQDTAPNWINADGDLHYCVYPNGAYDRPDYPYLTYNDLYNLQALLMQRGGAEDPALKSLMTAKRLWMDANGITEYQK